MVDGILRSDTRPDTHFENPDATIAAEPPRRGLRSVAVVMCGADARSSLR
jgi:hypothetical protein